MQWLFIIVSIINTQRLRYCAYKCTRKQCYVINNTMTTDRASFSERMRGAAADLIASTPRSHELTEVNTDYRPGPVTVYGKPDRSMRTEITLRDGRVVVVHQNMVEVIGLAAPRFTGIEVLNTERQQIGHIGLTINPDSSPFQPAYYGLLNGRMLAFVMGGDRTDLQLAEELVGYDALYSHHRRQLTSLGVARLAQELLPYIKPDYGPSDIPDELFYRPAASRVEVQPAPKAKAGGLKGLLRVFRRA